MSTSGSAPPATVRHLWKGRCWWHRGWSDDPCGGVVLLPRKNHNKNLLPPQQDRRPGSRRPHRTTRGFVCDGTRHRPCG